MGHEQQTNEIVWFATAVELAKRLIAVAANPPAPPTKGRTSDEFCTWTMALLGTVDQLERHLNPKRLSFDNADRRAVAGSGVLRCHGLMLLKRAFDDVLTAFQLMVTCHDGGICYSSDSENVPEGDWPSRAEHRGDIKVFEQPPPAAALKRMQEGCGLIMQDIGPQLQAAMLANTLAMELQKAMKDSVTNRNAAKTPNGGQQPPDAVDGPFGLNSFRYGTRTRGGLSATPFRLLRVLWQATDRTASFRYLAKAVWDDGETESINLRNDNRLGSARRAVNDFMKAGAFPFRVSTSPRNEVVALIESTGQPTPPPKSASGEKARKSPRPARQ